MKNVKDPEEIVHFVPRSIHHREKVWLVRFEGSESDFFRLFTSSDDLLNSLLLPPKNQHPSWKHPFEIWEIDFETGLSQEVSAEIMNVVATVDFIATRRVPEDYEESNPTALF